MLKFEGDVVRVCRCLATLNTNICITENIEHRSGIYKGGVCSTTPRTESCGQPPVNPPQFNLSGDMCESHDVARDTLLSFPFHPATTSTSPLRTITASYCLQRERI